MSRNYPQTAWRRFALIEILGMCGAADQYQKCAKGE
jgi:hypothetical protein